MMRPDTRKRRIAKFINHPEELISLYPLPSTEELIEALALQSATAVEDRKFSKRAKAAVISLELLNDHIEQAERYWLGQMQQQKSQGEGA